MNKSTIAVAVCAAFGVASISAWADAPAPAPMSSPSMTYPITPNPAPYSVDAGPLGKLFVTGAVSAIGLTQNHADPNYYGFGTNADKSSLVDISNAQVSIQKTDGMVQFFVEAGGYSFPQIGVPYLRSSDQTDATFGVLPVGYLKFAPCDCNFSLEAGKLPTLIGAEYAFSFENPNIERGLLWTQENVVSRGIQANYTAGPVALSVSWNDGYYSNKYNWLTGLATWTIDPANVLNFALGGNVNSTDPVDATNFFTTPAAQSNSDIYNLYYVHTAGAWTIEPFLQYQDFKSETFGSGVVLNSADVWGASLFVNYAIDSNYSLPVRLEYEDSSGSGNPLGYGSGTKAYSLTVTPTYQSKIFFVRGELSYVKVSSTPAGAFVFGSDGTATNQSRAMLETGVVF